MKFIRDLRKQSWRWRFLLLIGFLVFGTYLAFDVLDLDGSNLPSDISSNTIANLEATQTDAERTFRSHYSALATSWQARFLLIPQCSTELESPFARFPTRTVATPHPRILAHTHIGRDTAPSSSSSADPA